MWVRSRAPGLTSSASKSDTDRDIREYINFKKSPHLLTTWSLENKVRVGGFRGQTPRLALCLI